MKRRWTRLKRRLCELTSSWLFAETERELVILMYHGISETTTRDWGSAKYDITTREFESQLKSLSKQYDPISMDQLSRWIRGENDIPKRAFIITFDDALQNQFTNAVPVLESLNIPAIFYIPTAAIDDRTPLFERLLAKKIERLDIKNPARSYRKYYQKLRLNSPEFQMAAVNNLTRADERSSIHMTHEQVQRLVDHQLCSVGGHSHTHKHLTAYSAEEIEDELRTSKRRFKKLIQTNVNHFSYPYGDFDVTVRDTVADYGFETSVTTYPCQIKSRRCQNRFEIPRIDGATQSQEWFCDS